MLEKIQHFFGGIGKISHRKKDNAVYFTVKSVKDLMNVIIPRPSAVVRFAREAVFLLDPCQGQAKKTTHFEKYPLLTKKSVDFELFKEIVTLMYNKQHLDTDGLNKVMALKNSLNKGLTPFLSENFPNVNPIEISVRKYGFNNVNPY